MQALRILDGIQFTSLHQRVDATLLPEYKRFIALKVARHDFDAMILSPPSEIDTIWHQHILDTKHYRMMCAALGGTFIDHDPLGGVDAAARAVRRSAAVTEYEKAFGKAPGCWQTPPVRVKREADVDAEETISIKLMAQDGAEVHHKIKTTAQLGTVFNSYCQRQGVARNTVRFIFGGNHSFDWHTPKEIDLEDGDIIDVVIEQTGC